mmetsp:Transcript_5888/g.8331  ORF Transcript_5888/g.8331 Transcript_5888/m.8331 type:complete len:214 (-) Transcript_5888:133-774(-)
MARSLLKIKRLARRSGKSGEVVVQKPITSRKDHRKAEDACSVSTAVTDADSVTRSPKDNRLTKNSSEREGELFSSIVNNDDSLSATPVLLSLSNVRSQPRAKYSNSISASNPPIQLLGKIRPREFVEIKTLRALAFAGDSTRRMTTQSSNNNDDASFSEEQKSCAEEGPSSPSSKYLCNPTINRLRLMKREKELQFSKHKMDLPSVSDNGEQS